MSIRRQRQEIVYTGTYTITPQEFTSGYTISGIPSNFYFSGDIAYEPRTFYVDNGLAGGPEGYTVAVGRAIDAVFFLK
ncbi:hypothetical protein [Leadbettera azotonutricia]|uniref:hypothetical protein n=1 Tax=Leadbettera azotonutricia TaxID=150829 RepID=UPI0011D28403|nr:hypothetical protein [Leadbettera azotonutricia]